MTRRSLRDQVRRSLYWPRAVSAEAKLEYGVEAFGSAVCYRVSVLLGYILAAVAVLAPVARIEIGLEWDTIAGGVAVVLYLALGRFTLRDVSERSVSSIIPS